MINNLLKKLFRGLRSKVSIGTIVFSVLLVSLAVYYVVQSTSNFRQEYSAYAKLAFDNDAAAFLTGAESNASRQDLNTTLAQVLTGDIGNSKRLELANTGLELLKTTEQQINDVGDMAEHVQVAIAKMDLAANGASDFADKAAMRGIVALAKHRAEITQDIRGLSYRANFETAKVFKRIIDDKGRLTAAHISELNASLPALTEQFDKRTNLYTDLENIARQIKEDYGSL